MIVTSTHPSSECDRCLYRSGSSYLRCAVHPMGTSDSPCPDFAADPNPMPLPEWMSTEQWCGIELEIEDFDCELELVDELVWDELEEEEEDGKRGES